MREFLVYESNASRSELFIRMLYASFIEMVLGIYAILALFCSCLQWLGILFLGRRSEILTNVLIGYCEFFIQIIPYTYLLTDERPGVMPKELKVFLDNKEYLSFEKNASRLELIVRIFYSIPLFIVLFLFGIAASIVIVIQWLCILFTSGRNEDLNDFIKSFVKYQIQIISYINFVTDERPDILPKDIDVSLKFEFDKAETNTSGDIIKTTPPISIITKNRHIAIGIIFYFLFFVIIYLVFLYMYILMIFAMSM